MPARLAAICTTKGMCGGQATGELELMWILFMQIFDIPPETNTQQDTTSDDLMEVDGEKKNSRLDETTSASVVVNETEAKTSTPVAEDADMAVDLPEVRLKRRYHPRS